MQMNCPSSTLGTELICPVLKICLLFLILIPQGSRLPDGPALVASLFVDICFINCKLVEKSPVLQTTTIRTTRLVNTYIHEY